MPFRSLARPPDSLGLVPSVLGAPGPSAPQMSGWVLPPPPPRGPFLGPKFAPPSVVGRQPDCRPTARLVGRPPISASPDLFRPPPCQLSANSGSTGRLSAILGTWADHGPIIGPRADYRPILGPQFDPYTLPSHLWVNSSMPLLLNNSPKRPRM
ncbi:hypothetical protein M8J76_006760 [Diaphorina citri]|nr:hypothetical protein M8J77_017224 [Diaphorina citri]KAI5708946.1 hypothetical protein M8J76_006760 [Diaphorina citri]